MVKPVKGVLRIGHIEAQVGTKECGYLPICDLNGYGLQMPLMVINGLREGPTLCLIAGQHACEYTGIEAVMRIFTRINPKELGGAIIAIPVANVPAFQTRSETVNPMDGVNLNRAYPGDPEGSISFIMANIIFREVVMKSNYLIDIHGGDKSEENNDYVAVEVTGNEKVDKSSEALGKCFNSDYMWVKDYKPGPGIFHFEGQVCLTASRAGIPAVVTEAGHSGKIQEDSVKFLLNGITNVMKYLNMIKGKPKIGEPKIIKTRHILKTRSAGFFSPSLKLGDMVSKGEIVGTIRNFFGEVIEEVRSPSEGVLDWLFFHASVIPGSELMIISEIVK